MRPEVSRTKTFGAKGVSGGQWWKQHLQYILLNQNPVDFSAKNLSYVTEARILFVFLFSFFFLFLPFVFFFFLCFLFLSFFSFFFLFTCRQL